ncbi:MAG: hypothetical protein H0W83_13960 [Planctomycetes bacterium]|nr:hypothetical protein [Planctomycetota bacterium]
MLAAHDLGVVLDGRGFPGDHQDEGVHPVLDDPDDRHVLAAAIKCPAGVIVPMNLADFPAAVLSAYGIDAQHPDEFIRHLLDLNPGAVCTAVKKTRARLRSPPKSVDDYLDMEAPLGLDYSSLILHLRPW